MLSFFIYFNEKYTLLLKMGLKYLSFLLVVHIFAKVL